MAQAFWFWTIFKIAIPNKFEFVKNTNLHLVKTKYLVSSHASSSFLTKAPVQYLLENRSECHVLGTNT